MDEYYEHILRLLADGWGPDWKEACLRIAQKNPKVFCEALDEIPWQVEVHKIFSSEGKISAVKYVRTKTGGTLKEALKKVEETCGHEQEKPRARIPTTAVCRP